jgi:SAM-dependent methyltransferase
MYFDFAEVQRFYQSDLGQRVRYYVGEEVCQQFSDLKNSHVLGFGFTQPFLSLMEGVPLSMATLLPARMGVAPWVGERGNRSAMVNGKSLPLKDESYERVLLVHALEFSRNPSVLLREIWRVLAPGGELVVVVPARTGLWSHSEFTPFGHGEPLSSKQLKTLLESQLFEIEASKGALHFPPTKLFSLDASFATMEKVGRVIWPGLAGVNLVKARKKLFEGDKGQKERIKRRVVEPVKLFKTSE